MCHGTASHQTFQPCLPWPTMGLSLTMLTPYLSALLQGALITSARSLDYKLIIVDSIYTVMTLGN